MKAPLSLGMESLRYAMGKPHEHQYMDGRCLVCQELEPEFEQSFSEWLDAHSDYLSESPDPHYAPENNAEID